MAARRSYHQYCGLAAALDLVGERWALLIVRELDPGPRRFTDLFEGLPGISTDLLTERLRQLEAAGAVHRTDVRHPVPAKLYALTPRGAELAELAGRLALWGIPLLPPEPDDSTHLRPKWALQTMVRSYTGGLDAGAYELIIDGDAVTVQIDDAGACLRYGPGLEPIRLRISCSAEAFFALVAEGAREGVEVMVGTAALLRRFTTRLPLAVGSRRQAGGLRTMV